MKKEAKHKKYAPSMTIINEHSNEEKSEEMQPAKVESSLAQNIHYLSKVKDNIEYDERIRYIIDMETSREENFAEPKVNVE